MKTLIKLLVVSAALVLPSFHAVAGYHSTAATASNGGNDYSGFNISIPNGGAAGYVLSIYGYGYGSGNASASVSGNGLSIGGSRSTDGSSGDGGAVGAGSVSASLYASAGSDSYASAMAWVSW